MKTLIAVTAILLALAACNKNLSIEQATYKDYPGMSAEKRAKCRAIGEDIYWADVVKRSNDDRGYSRLAAAEAFEKCMES